MRSAFFASHDITALVFAEPERVSGERRRAFKHGTDSGRHRHFGERDQKAAVGDVVRRGHQAVADQATDEIAMASLRGEIDRRRRALLAAADFAQIDRLAEPALGFADQQDRFALGFEGEASSTW